MNAGLQKGWWLGLSFFLWACQQQSQTAQPLVVNQELTSGMVARCADAPVPAAAVAAVARERHVSNEKAVQTLLADACFAVAATADGLPKTPRVAASLRATYVRALLTHLHRDTKADPTADELAQFRERHWREVDRPEGVQIVHTVFLAEERESDREKRQNAIEEANGLFASTQKAASAFEFKQIVTQTLGPSRADVRTEELPPFAADGRSFAPDGGDLDPVFAKAAHQANEEARVRRVDTKFGAHVIFLRERLPANHLAATELKLLATEELHAERTRLGYVALLRELRTKVGVQVERNAEEKTLILFAKGHPVP